VTGDGSTEESKKIVTVTAKSTTDESKRATASVYLVPGKHFEIVPGSASVLTGQQLPLRTPTAEASWKINAPAALPSRRMASSPLTWLASGRWSYR